MPRHPRREGVSRLYAGSHVVALSRHRLGLGPRWSGDWRDRTYSPRLWPTGSMASGGGEGEGFFRGRGEGRVRGEGVGAEPLKLEGLVAAMLWQRRSKHDPPTPNPPPSLRGFGGALSPWMPWPAAGGAGCPVAPWDPRGHAEPDRANEGDGQGLHKRGAFARLASQHGRG